MIKKLKYCLKCLLDLRQVRMGVTALFTALTFVAITLLGCPIHTTEIFDGQRFYNLNKIFTDSATVIGVNSQTANVHENVATAVSYPVYVTCGDKTVTVDFTGGTVADALTLAGFTPDSDDFVLPALEAQVETTVYIDYADVEYVKGSYIETIPHTTKVIYTSSEKKGYTKLTTKGVNGKKEITYTEKKVNGVSKGKTVTSQKVISKPAQAIKVVGTKTSAVKTSADVDDISTLIPKKEIKLDKNGNPVKYKKKMTVRATAYTYTGNNCSTGVAPQPGYIAVNPKVIPYGTKMYIKSPDGRIIYGYAVAADTGGFIKNHPTGIDLFMTTEGACRNFGVRNMEIYILE